jgi:hypothetical protein
MCLMKTGGGKWWDVLLEISRFEAGGMTGGTMVRTGAEAHNCGGYVGSGLARWDKAGARVLCVLNRAPSGGFSTVLAVGG